MIDFSRIKWISIVLKEKGYEKTKDMKKQVVQFFFKGYAAREV